MLESLDFDRLLNKWKHSLQANAYIKKEVVEEKNELVGELLKVPEKE